MKKMVKMMTIALTTIVMAVGLAACSEDSDDEMNFYTVGIGTVHIATGGSIEEMKAKKEAKEKLIEEIFAVYYEATGATDGRISISGNTQDADTKVKVACQKAEQTLASKSLDAFETGDEVEVLVSRDATGNPITIYSKSFKK